MLSKIYIAGKRTGWSDRNEKREQNKIYFLLHKYRIAYEVIENSGNIPLSTIRKRQLPDTCEYYQRPYLVFPSYLTSFEMIERSDYLYLLNNWFFCNTCRQEFEYAMRMSKPIILEDQLSNGKKTEKNRIENAIKNSYE